MGFGAATDNQGNSKLIERHLTTKHPLNLILLELTSQLQLRNLTLNLGWLERGANQHADDLTNDRFEDFTDALRIKVEWEDLNFLKLGKLLAVAEDFRREVEAAKQEASVKVVPLLQARPKKRAKLRERDPW